MTPVSVVVPTGNRPTMLRRTLRSIAAQRPVGAGHRHPVAEVIVVFDQSPPEKSLAFEFSDFDVTILQNAHRPGRAGARNTGIAAAGSTWIAFCDDADWWAPTKLRDQAATADRYPGADFIVGNIAVVTGRRRTVRTAGMDQIHFEDLLRDRIISAHPSTFVVRSKAVTDHLGLFDEQLPGGFAADYDWLLRAARQTPIAVAPQTVTFVEAPAKSSSGGRWAMLDQALLQLVDKHPEFHQHPQGMAQITGRRAFAQAAMGDRRRAFDTMRSTFGLNWKEPGAYLSVPVALGVVSGDRMVRVASRFGRRI